MQILITLDYELFFGNTPGTVSKSIIEPTNALINICKKYNIKMNYFVDAGYLLKLKENKSKYQQCEKEYNLVFKQLDYLNKNGHDLQLHIHSHWEDSYFNGEKWVFDITRYRLHDFAEPEIEQIINNYKSILGETSDNVFAYRAGGWCIQPFSKIKEGMKKNNIWLDSTVYNNGVNLGESHYYDFRNAPSKTIWRFEEDPTKEDSEGFFTEIPITSVFFSPLFFWRFAYYKKFPKSAHKMLGNGDALQQYSSSRIINMLLKGNNNCVSTDGLKSIYLERAISQATKKFTDRDFFVTIGHPKAITKFSINVLDEFIRKNTRKHNFTTYNEVSLVL